MLTYAPRSLLLLLLLAVSSCATQEVAPTAPPSVVSLPRAQVEPLPQDLDREAEPTFQERLLRFFSN